MDNTALPRVSRPVVLVLSNEKLVTESFIQRLVDVGCRVVVCSSVGKQLDTNSSFVEFLKIDMLNTVGPNYVIYIGGFDEPIDSRLVEVFLNCVDLQIKAVFVSSKFTVDEMGVSSLIDKIAEFTDGPRVFLWEDNDRSKLGKFVNAAVGKVFSFAVPSKVLMFDGKESQIDFGESKEKLEQVAKKEKITTGKKTALIGEGVRNRGKYRKYITFALAVAVLWFLVIPFIALLVSYLTLRFGYASAEWLKVSAKANSIARERMGYFSNTPILKNAYLSGLNVTNTLSRLAEVAQQEIKLDGLFNSFSKNLSNSTSQDSAAVMVDYKLTSSALYRNLSFLKSDANGLLDLVNSIYPDYNMVDAKRKESLGLVSLLSSSGNFLGLNEKATYAIILQDTSQVRATGGRLQALALVDIRDGKIGDYSVSDIDQADNLFRGMAIPPETWEDFTGRDSWLLRDANWDPDFEVSAERMAWFVYQELGKNVDVVLTITNGAAAEVLRKSNIETQETKSNLLSLLIQKLASGQISIYKNSELFSHLLQTKQLLVYSPSLDALLALRTLGVSGFVGGAGCESENCADSWFGYFFDNFSNDASGMVNIKAANLIATVSNTAVENKLKVAFELTPTSTKNIYRLVLPKKAVVKNVILKNGDTQKFVSFTTSLYGVRNDILVDLDTELDANSGGLIEINWSLPVALEFGKPGGISFTWLAQPGLDSYPAAVELNYPSDIQISTSVSPVLTSGASVLYNVALQEDFSSDLFWLP